MATLGQFAVNMRRHAQNIEANRTRAKRMVAIAVLQPVVTGTPVGNPTLWSERKRPPGYAGGRARGNWQVGLGGSPGGETGRKDVAGSATIADGNGKIGAAGDGPIYLTNNVPYIVPLNDGHSKQAPAGFVQRAIAAGTAKAREVQLLKG